MKKKEKPTIGRPSRFGEKTSVHGIRIPDSSWQEFPEPKTVFVRDAVLEKMDNIKR